VIQRRGHEAEPVNVKQALDPGAESYDGVIVGASIHMGKHDKHVVEFVQRNRDALDRIPCAFFSASLSAHDDTEEAAGYVEQFERETGWRPASIAVFGDALLYTQYGFIKRHVMRKIAQDKPSNLGTDTARDYVYTDWAACHASPRTS
jgi:menaquinone-dependent protoporphyrinogen oxidase